MANKFDKHTKAVLAVVGLHIRQVREAQKMPQVQLAKSIGMDPTNLAKVERGARNVTIDTLVRIADGLGLDLTVKLTKRH